MGIICVCLCITDTHALTHKQLLIAWLSIVIVFSPTRQASCGQVYDSGVVLMEGFYIWGFQTIFQYGCHRWFPSLILLPSSNSSLPLLFFFLLRFYSLLHVMLFCGVSFILSQFRNKPATLDIYPQHDTATQVIYRWDLIIIWSILTMATVAKHISYCEIQ